jgi:hypothetical protein
MCQESPARLGLSGCRVTASFDVDNVSRHANGVAQLLRCACGLSVCLQSVSCAPLLACEVLVGVHASNKTATLCMRSERLFAERILCTTPRLRGVGWGTCIKQDRDSNACGLSVCLQSVSCAPLLACEVLVGVQASNKTASLCMRCERLFALRILRTTPRLRGVGWGTCIEHCV